MATTLILKAQCGCGYEVIKPTTVADAHDPAVHAGLATFFADAFAHAITKKHTLTLAGEIRVPQEDRRRVLA